MLIPCCCRVRDRERGLHSQRCECTSSKRRLRAQGNLRRRPPPKGERSMSSKLALAAALLAIAVPTAAQPPAQAQAAPEAAPSGPQAALQQAATAFGRCVSAGMDHVDASATPEASAASVMAGCAA